MDHPIFELSERIVRAVAEFNPEEATMEGIAGYGDRWPDLSPDGIDARLDGFNALRRELGGLPAPVDARSANALRAARDFLDIAIGRMERGELLRDLNSIASPVQLRNVFDVMSTASAEHWDDIAARLESMGSLFASYRASLERGRASGETVARRQVEAAAEEAAFYASDGSPLEGLPGQVHGLADDRRVERVVAAVAVARRAYGELADYLEHTYLPDAVAADGVGEERYALSAARFLGANIDFAETYQWGWDEVGRIRAEMARVAGEILPGGSIPATIELLDSDPRRASRDRTDFVRTMTERQLAALGDLDGSAFEIADPVRRIEVKISPPGGALGAHYVGPSEDFSRPGSVWYSLDEDEERIPLYRQVSTNYHEGFPGHHLQEGSRKLNADRLSRLQSTFIWYSGYGEGWALYAERLMHELGYLEKPEFVFGKYAEEMLRACRVVIDIGCHLGLSIPRNQPFHPGEPWSFDTGARMLVDYANQTEPYALSEMTRYMGWPGQAISYKVGERTILELRDDTKRHLGGRFRLIDFHSKILGAGSLGLDHLRDIFGD